jgi:hypothetical protein
MGAWTTIASSATHYEGPPAALRPGLIPSGAGRTVPQNRPECGNASTCCGHQGAFPGVGHAPRSRK